MYVFLSYDLNEMRSWAHPLGVAPEPQEISQKCYKGQYEFCLSHFLSRNSASENCAGILEFVTTFTQLFKVPAGSWSCTESKVGTQPPSKVANGVTETH